MDTSFLRMLWAKYKVHASPGVDPLNAVLQRQRELKRTRFVDLAATATSLAYSDQIALDPLALKAIADTNPNFDHAHLGHYSPQEWMGMVNTAKGKYFEYLVVDHLNKHEQVGDLYLTHGQHAALADSMTQPGWDISVTDAHGQVVELIQLKATESASYIGHALDRYPDIRILTTDEIFNKMPDHSMVLDSNIKEADLHHMIDDTFRGMEPGFMDDFWHSFHPLLPLLVITGMQGYKVVIGNQRIHEAALVARDRAKRSLAAGLAGAVAKALSHSFLVAAPVGILTGMWFDRGANIDAMAKATREQVARLGARSDYWNGLLAQGT